MTARDLRTALLFGFVLLIGVFMVAPARGVGELVVDTLGDAGDGACDPGSCTLRDAIIAANGNADANVITFTVDGTIVLQSTLTVGNDLIIDGTGHNIAISGDNKHRVFHLVAGNNTPVLEIKSLRISIGKSANGGGFFNDGGELLVTDAEILGNEGSTAGGGIYNNGGGVTVTRSLFYNNKAPGLGGGGIYNVGGTVTVTDSTFTGNFGTVGGGYFNQNGSTTITNSTLNTNTAGVSGGAVYVKGGSLLLANSTVAGNGNEFASVGGLLQFVPEGGTLTVRNSIVAGNTGGDCGGTITNGGNNINSDATCGWGVVDGSMSNVDPKLGPLDINGGTTHTMALLPGSPAIDGVTFNAPNDCPIFDQRGVARPLGVACDIGAFESPLQTGPDLVVNLLEDSDDGVCEHFYLDLGTDCTLREAVNFANGNPDANTITFNLSGTIVLQDSLTVGNDLVIDGTGRDIAVSGDRKYRVLNLVAGNNTPVVELIALTITKGASDQGGGVYNGGAELSAERVNFDDNDASGQGAAIYNAVGAVTVDQSRFSSNSVMGNGGAIYNAGGSLAVTASTFTTNEASNGGGIYNNGGTAAVTNSTLTANTAFGGAGLYQFAGSTTVTNSTIAGNAAGGQGGGLFNFDGTMTARNTIIAANTGGNCALAISNGGNNLDSGETCGWGTNNGSLSNTDPLLGPLADNGGPTQTMNLQPGSPAIDGVMFNAPNDCPATDQRGAARPFGDACDMGAVESSSPPPPTPTPTPTPPPTPTPSPTPPPPDDFVLYLPMIVR